MPIDLPTIERFNNWSNENKRLWLLYETAGNYSPPNICGFIFYDKHNMVLKYKMDKVGQLIEAEAMTLTEGSEAFKQYNTAMTATMHKN